MNASEEKFEEEPMSGSEMFWTAFFVSLYIYGTYLIIHNKVFVGTNKPNYNLFTNFHGLEGVVMWYWLIINLIITIIIVAFFFSLIPDILDAINKFLDKTLK